MDLSIGELAAVPALQRPDLLAAPVAAALRAAPALAAVTGVAEIDPACADTAAFGARYGVDPGASANCVVVAGHRQGVERFAACLLLATTRAEVNTVVRRLLDLRKVSFAPTEQAVQRTGMEYGGITPIGLPAGWPLLIDAAVPAAGRVIVGSGVRRSKLTVPADLLTQLPEVKVVEGLARPVAG